MIANGLAIRSGILSLQAELVRSDATPRCRRAALRSFQATLSPFNSDR